ncbi:hypothetical protein D9M73_265490 [compost metagenome]
MPVTPELQGKQREQHRLTGTGRANDQHVADVADMGGQAERRRTARLGKEQWRTIEMGVADRPSPDRRQRHQMGKIQRVDQGLPDIRVNLPGQ